MSRMKARKESRIEAASVLERFRAMAKTYVPRDPNGWVYTDEWVDACDEHGVFDGKTIAVMVRNYKRDQVRRMLRQCNESPGEEWVNLARLTAEGKPDNAYKQLMMFDTGDVNQLLRDRLRRAKKWIDEAVRFAKYFLPQFGPQILDPFPDLKQLMFPNT